MNIAESLPVNRTLVIGVGNDYARDDAAGLLVARTLRERVRNDMTVVECTGDGVSIMEAWKDVGAAIVIDAVHSGAEVGTIYRFDARQTPLPARPFRGSTHAFGLYEAVELGRSLNQLPPRLIVYGIEGQNFTVGSEVSAAVLRAVGEVAQSVLHDVEAPQQAQHDASMNNIKTSGGGWQPVRSKDPL
jgi:hydrogenase maturation protease